MMNVDSEMGENKQGKKTGRDRKQSGREERGEVISSLCKTAIFFEVS
jgi:hypothetical protein